MSTSNGVDPGSPTPPTPPAPPGPVSRLDRIPAGRHHVVWVIVLGAAYLVENFDNVVFAYLAPAVRAEWGLTLGQVGAITSAVFLGMLVGAVFGGRLSDRVGRRTVLIGSSVFYSLASLLSAVAPNYEVLLVGRVLTGVGVQAATGVLMVYLSEMFPRLSRGRFFTVMTFCGSVAAPLAAVLAAAIAPQGPGAWRWVFVMGAAGLVIAVVVAAVLPETVRWLVANGRTEQAEAVVDRLERAARTPLPPAGPEPTAVPVGSVRDLLDPIYRHRLIVLGGSFALLIFCLYGFLSWFPTVLADRGGQTEVPSAAVLIAAAPLVAPLLLFLVADRIERRSALLIAGTVSGGALIAFGYTTDPVLTVVTGVLVGVGLSWASTSFYTYIPEVFPTEVRGVGAGCVNGVGRVAGVVSGLTVAALYGAWGPGPLYLLLGLGLVAMGGLVALFGPRTTRRSLETISTQDTADRPAAHT
ncbi:MULTISPECIES: MFS transporter [Pseudonocardia]|uniref:Inner membrane metabolite transport protein YdjE n=2 Tax=Pseudonocardia TaxID=1847 RepID=A0A1Y2MJ32_PSEAH|nr:MULTISPECIES: MFS transporter [Pseudonocardia]OSY35250.1 Inner membrane metabolite transport protein YdjE [Pseudonocardia autotrophica]TDN73149.1 putative MFS transporter [Pseudonocardia autotrophica]BBG03871.1 MFS transporter [Pseudonocardia autotrophica]GEC29536.1 MFS transporter [Pseudonocardia saturnea]